MVKNLLPTQAMQVRSLVGELRHHMPRGKLSPHIATTEPHAPQLERSPSTAVDSLCTTAKTGAAESINQSINVNQYYIKTDAAESINQSILRNNVLT